MTTLEHENIKELTEKLLDLIAKTSVEIGHKTGNVYVEFQSRGKDSGIKVSNAGTWIFKIVSAKDTHLFSIQIPLSRLKKLVSKDYRVVPGGDNLTSRGYLVPILDLVKV